MNPAATRPAIYKIRPPGIYSHEVNKRQRQRARLALAVTLAILAFLAIEQRLQPPPDAWMLATTNNPDHFFIWTTNGAAYFHTFTYDPHAADDWLRESPASAGLSNAPSAGDARHGRQSF